MHEVVEIKLRGPRRLTLGGAESLFADAEAWRPGLYVWTFHYNQADRIHHVGASSTSIALDHAAHLAAFLRGDYAVHDADARAAGELREVYSPGQGTAALCACRAHLLDELAALRVLYAEIPSTILTPARAAGALAAHLRKLGGKAVAWLAGAPAAVPEPAAPGGSPVTLRFYRPVFMASMPEELLAH